MGWVEEEPGEKSFLWSLAGWRRRDGAMGREDETSNAGEVEGKERAVRITFPAQMRKARC